MGSRPILPFKVPVNIDTMLKFHGDCDGEGHSVGMCKYTLTEMLQGMC